MIERLKSVFQNRDDIMRYSNIRYVALAITIIVAITLLYSFTRKPNELVINPLPIPWRRSQLGYSVWPRFYVDTPHSHEKYQFLCFENDMKRHIIDLPKNMAKWSQSVERVCQELWAKMERIYEVHEELATTGLTGKFELKVRGWLNNDPYLFKMLEKQEIIQITNRYNQEQMINNAVRNKRPQKPGSEHPHDYVKRMVAETITGCDFCAAEEFTATDTLGRMSNRNAVSASNVFKLDKWHSLFLTKTHSPVNLTMEQVVDLLTLSVDWYQRTYKNDAQYKYVNMIWDVLYHAGASQVHPHLQGSISRNHYYQEFERQRMAAEKYFTDFNSNYFSDLVALHKVLGLTLRFNDAVAVAHLTPKKEHEFLLMSYDPGDSLFKLLWYVLKTYWSIGKVCYSMGITYPEQGSTDRSAGRIPAMIRVGTRGDCTSVYNDVSSFDLYVAPNVNTDPYESLSLLQKMISDTNGEDLYTTF